MWLNTVRVCQEGRKEGGKAEKRRRRKEEEEGKKEAGYGESEGKNKMKGGGGQGGMIEGVKEDCHEVSMRFSLSVRPSAAVR